MLILLYGALFILPTFLLLVLAPVPVAVATAPQLRSVVLWLFGWGMLRTLGVGVVSVFLWSVLVNVAMLCFVVLLVVVGVVLLLLALEFSGDQAWTLLQLSADRARAASRSAHAATRTKL